MSKTPIALQMYTVRDLAAQDYVGTLRRVAEIGYAGVELAGFPIPVSELKLAVDDLGLKVPSMHVGYGALINETASQIDIGLEIGVQYLTCSGIFNTLRDTSDGFREAAESLSRVGEECIKQGLGVCYHNHAFEFVKFDGKAAYDLLFETDPSTLLEAEIDTYWVQHAGEDPSALIRAYAGRCPLVHIKDMADDADQSFAEIGAGVMDFDGIFAACEVAGVLWYIVEQDSCKGDPLESIWTSFENLKRMGRV